MIRFSIRAINHLHINSLKQISAIDKSGRYARLSTRLLTFRNTFILKMTLTSIYVIIGCSSFYLLCNLPDSENNLKPFLPSFISIDDVHLLLYALMTGIGNNEIWCFWFVGQPIKAQLLPGITSTLHSELTKFRPDRQQT